VNDRLMSLGMIASRMDRAAPFFIVQLISSVIYHAERGKEKVIYDRKREDFSE